MQDEKYNENIKNKNGRDNMKKKILSVLLASVILSATACNSKEYTAQKTYTVSETKIDTKNKSDGSVAAVTVTPEPEDERILNTNERARNQYDVLIKLDTENKTLNIEQKLTYINNTGSDQEEIYFNLIPNAFTKKNGGIEVNSMKIGTEEIELKKVEETVYRLPLTAPLEKGKSVTIDMDYVVKIPKISDRFGYNGNTYNLGNVLITPALFENGKWLCQPYVDLGDAFYTEISDYRVSIDVPDGYMIASSGTLINDVYIAENMRDFAFTASSDLAFLCEECEDIALNVYYPKDHPNTGKHVMDVAKRSLSLFNGLLGKYPYDTLNIVCTSMPGGIGGMEYPGLIMMTVEPDIESALDLYNGTITLDDYLKKMNDQYSGDKPDKLSDIESSVETVSTDQTYDAILYIVDSLTRSTAHEIAHQWFYGIVGNDEIRYPWIDEGMCRFLEGYYAKYYKQGENHTFSVFEMLKNHDQAVYEEHEGADRECRSVNLNESLYDLKRHSEDYGEIYYKGAAMIYHMYEKMGEDAFAEALKEYVETFAYTEVTPDEFIDFWSEKGDFKEMFEIYLPQNS